jgi:glutathione S-transferase
MALTLHYHPLSSFCWKALVGLYELGVPFEKHIVDLADAEARAAFVALWPIGKFPVLHDEPRNKVVPESSIVLEYIDRLPKENGKRLIPADPTQALECRLRERLFDLYVHLPMQKIVGDRLRPADRRDPLGVEQARAQIEAAYALLEEQLADGPWAAGTAFTIVDCAALPALYYGNKVVPFEGRKKNLTAYFGRLEQRPSAARVLAEAAPYFGMFPG